MKEPCVLKNLIAYLFSRYIVLLKKSSIWSYMLKLLVPGLYSWFGEGRRGTKEDTEGKLFKMVFLSLLRCHFSSSILLHKGTTEAGWAQNRDQFRKLLEDHIADGSLTAKTHWLDYCLKVVLIFIKIREQNFEVLSSLKYWGEQNYWWRSSQSFV